MSLQPKCRLTLIIFYLNINLDFRKGYNAQHCLVSMIKKWKESVDSGGAFGTLMTDLSKAFDCLHHELLIANIDAYGFDIKPVKLIQQYHREQSLVRLFSTSFCATYFTSLK